MKSVVKAFDKYVKNNLPLANPVTIAIAKAAYLAGRRDLQNDVDRRLQLEAERRRLTSRK